jgi:glycosyltransferase involved in cell wall biosynthesis
MRISIVTPSYNSARFIERTLQSVLGQSGAFDLEYIVIDGGSDDGTVDILRRYANRLTWISEQDGGQSDAINKGLRLTSGDVLSWINADDLLLPGALDAVARHFTATESVWSFGRCDIIDEEDRTIRRWITAYKNRSLKRASRRRLLAENFISQPAVFWTRSAMDTVGLLDESEHLVMDYEYWLRLWTHFEPARIDACLAAFRWYETSKSGSLYRRQFADEYRVARRYAGSFTYPIALHALNYVKITGAYGLMSLLRKIG